MLITNLQVVSGPLILKICGCPRLHVGCPRLHDSSYIGFDSFSTGFSVLIQIIDSPNSFIWICSRLIVILAMYRTAPKEAVHAEIVNIGKVSEIGRISPIWV